MVISGHRQFEKVLSFFKESCAIPWDMHHDCHLIPLEGSVSRKSVWLTPVPTDGIKLDPSPPIADWETTLEEVGL